MSNQTINKNSNPQLVFTYGYVISFLPTKEPSYGGDWQATKAKRKQKRQGMKKKKKRIMETTICFSLKKGAKHTRSK